MTLEGFDVSKWQAGAYVGGRGFAFGIAKATEGIGYKDAAYDRHMGAIRGSGIVAGAYHFARPDLNPGNPEGEADWFLSVVGDPAGMILAQDAESAGGSADWCDRFQRRIADRLGGYRAWFYSYWQWIQSRGILGSPILGRDPLWLAWPDSNGPLPISCSAQQYGGVDVPGLGGGVDANRFFGDLSQLKALTVGGDSLTPEEHDMLSRTRDLGEAIHKLLIFGNNDGPTSGEWLWGISNGKPGGSQIADLAAAVANLQVPAAQLKPVLDAIAALKAELATLTLKRA